MLCIACVLDLRSKFPLAAAGEGGGGGHPDALNLNAGEETHDGSSRGCCWRERALALERELQQLQNQYRSESLGAVLISLFTISFHPCFPCLCSKEREPMNAGLGID